MFRSRRIAALLITILLSLTIKAQDFNVGFYPSLNMPLLIKNSVTKGKPAAGFGINLGLVPTNSDFGIQAQVYYENYFSYDEKIKIEIENTNNPQYEGSDICDVSTKHFKIGLNIGIGYPGKRDNRSVTPIFGFYFYQYDFSYLYEGSNVIDNIYLDQVSPTKYIFDTGSLGIELGMYKYYQFDKARFFWAFSWCYQKLDFDERTYGFYHLKTLPFSSFTFRLGYSLPLKPIIEKISIY